MTSFIFRLRPFISPTARLVGRPCPVVADVRQVIAGMPAVIAGVPAVIAGVPAVIAGGPPFIASVR
jgi:hypothetical protein